MQSTAQLSDYSPALATITFPAGVASVNATVSILPDNVPELLERFFLTLRSVTVTDGSLDASSLDVQTKVRPCFTSFSSFLFLFPYLPQSRSHETQT